jgi:hypothetical protein
MTFTGEEEPSEAPDSVFRTPVSTTSASASPEPTEEPARFATETAINREGQYSFDHPTRWEVVTDGTVSTVTSPKGDVVIRLGFAPQGSLPSATTELSELVRSSYDVLRMGTPIQTLIGGASALVFDGRANNAAGTEMSFGVTTVRGAGDNYAITVFSYPDLDRRLEATIEEVVASFMVGGTS